MHVHRTSEHITLHTIYLGNKRMNPLKGSNKTFSKCTRKEGGGTQMEPQYRNIKKDACKEELKIHR